MSKLERRIDGQFKYYVFLSVVYATLMITAQAVAYRMIELGDFLEPGGIFIFPATFAVSDIIAEVYGPTLARRSIIFTLYAQAFYSLVPMIVNTLPHPSSWHHSAAYHVVFASSWLVFISNLLAVMFGMIVNTQIIGKTKLITRGKFFSLRSLFSSAIGEVVSTGIIVAIAMMPVVGMDHGVQLFISMFTFKLIFSLVAVYPASLLVTLFKKLDNVDIYEENVTLNPLSAFIGKDEKEMSDVIDFYKTKQSRLNNQAVK